MPVTPQAVDHLALNGHQAVHASTIGLSSASDTDLLDLARVEGRIVVTADLDYPRLLALHKASSPGVILFRGGAYSDLEMLNLLDRVLAQVPEPELVRSITVIDRARIRKRRLPDPEPSQPS